MRDDVPQLEQDMTWAVRPELVPALRAALTTIPDSRQAATQTAREEPQAALSRIDTAGGGVAVIPLRGVITARPSLMSLLFGGGGGLGAFREAFREALRSDEVDAILLDIDSPGGTCSLITETATEIREARGEKPIVAMANTQAASAAYWLASQADELVVTPSGYVGSIGVFLLHVDYSAMNEQMGVDPTFVYAGRYKVEGNPEEPLADEARAEFQREVDEIYELFTEEVALGRGLPADVVRSETFGEGRMLSANRAVAAGMADRVDTYEATVARLAGGSTPPRSESTTRAGRSRFASLALARPGHVQPKEG